MTDAIRATDEVLRSLPDFPYESLWGEHDPVLSLDLGRRVCAAIGCDAPEVIEGAGHFLQEDRGAQIGDRIAAWLRSDDVSQA